MHPPDTSEASPAVEVQNLVVEFPGVRALDGVSFALPAGAITALVGPNGAGKTTLMRCLVALDAPFSGRIRVAGFDTQESPREVHRRIGWLPDDFGLYEDLSVAQCVRYAGASRGLAGAVLEARLQAVREATELDSLWAQRAGSLSRGQRQRVGLAQALVHDPPVLVLDEPASGLDPAARAALAELITRLGQAGKSVLVSSHILAELEGYATWMLTLEAGRVRGLVAVQGHVATGGRWLRLRVVGPPEAAAERLQAWEGVGDLQLLPDGVRLEWRRPEAEQAELLLHLLNAGVRVVGLAPESADLQAMYLAQVRHPEAP
ncbi:MAG: ATP-binding cassette domain-containing protein [Candidatus Sericytochromatia bacterium]|nr:ATP-binding cassette domain-containing protein [Candidatus Sericytochromatia bacterium]